MTSRRKSGKAAKREIVMKATKTFRKEASNILFLMAVFLGLFAFYLSYNVNHNLVGASLLIYGIFVVWGAFIFLRKKFEIGTFFIFKGFSWIFISIICLLFSIVIVKYYLRIEGVALYVLITLTYAVSGFYRVIRIKNLVLMNSVVNKKNNKIVNLAVSFASFGYVLTYLLIKTKRLNQNTMRLILIFCLMFFAYDFLNNGIFFVYQGLRNDEKASEELRS